MTKSRDNKQAIRAYMRTHGVNYTTAKRALAARPRLTAAQVAESSRIAQEADDNTALGPISYADDTNTAAPLVKNTAHADSTGTCPDCGHGTSDGRLACDPNCPQGRHLDKSPTRDRDGYALTIRRAPVYLDPYLQRDALGTFPHVHDLNGTCIHNRGRDLCQQPLGETPPRPTVAAITAAYARTGSVDARSALPVFIDPTKATSADQTRAQHLHDLNGRCLKNRNGHFCSNPQINLLHDLNTHLKVRGPRTGDDAGKIHTINKPQPKTRTNRNRNRVDGLDHGSDHAPMNPTFIVDEAWHATNDNYISRNLILDDTPTERDTTNQVASLLGLASHTVATTHTVHLDAQPATIKDLTVDSRGRIIDRPTPGSDGSAAGDPTEQPLPDGATVRQWYATTIDPETGDRVPTLFTQTRYPTDEHGRRREVITQTPITGDLDTDTTWKAIADVPTRRDELKAALKTDTKATRKPEGKPVTDDALNSHRRAHAPGPAPADIQSALEQLADNELALREHTSDPETPVTYEMLRHAILATSTHGETWGGSKWNPTAADVCRSYLLGVHVTTSTPDSTDTPDVDGQHEVHPEDLAGLLTMLADDELTLDEAAEGTAVTADDIAEELLILATRLGEPSPSTTDPKADVSPRTDDHRHYLVVHEPTTAHHRGRHTIDCTTPPANLALDGSCEGWEECGTCRQSDLDDDTYDDLYDTGTLHGVEHINLGFGPAIRTGKCALQAFPEAWEDSDAILNLPPGRYAINSTWEDEYCTIWLRTH